MHLKRDEQNIIVTANEDGSEIHPYITTLAAIEAQQRIIPPMVPRLTSVGWDSVKGALLDAIAVLITAEDLPIIQSDPVENIENEIVEPSIDKPISSRKPQKPIYKSA